MFFLARPDTQAVHLLADLLETIEVAADELMDKKLDARDIGAIRAMSEEEVEAQLAGLRKFIAGVRELELGIVAKLGQARDRARAVARSDWRLRPIMMLFTAGTQAFADRCEAEPSPAVADFDGAGLVFPFLRSRGLISPMTTHYDGSAELLVTDSFRLYGVLPLRDLIERCEATLNALDAHYDLFAEEADSGEEASVVVVAVQTAAPVALAPAQEAATVEAIAFAQPEASAIAVAIAPAAEAATTAAVAQVPADEAVAAQDAALKGLTERLAEMKAEPDVVADIGTKQTASAA